MPRKIAIIPTFTSSHFLKCWIPNVIEVLNPDIIIINEGLFPGGPENKGHLDEEFRKKYCHSKYPNCGFDIIESQLAVLPHNFDKKSPGETGFKFNPRVHLNYVSYLGLVDVNECFLQCMTSFDRYIPEVGDLIFPLEPDAFHHEKDIEAINWYLERLKPGEGLKTRWVDFLETQYYIEAINIVQPKYRRFVYCFDNMENYKSAINGFMSQNYPKLKQIDDFLTFHYPWFVYDRWKELRYELIYRSDPQYWKDFERGLREIRIKSSAYLHEKNNFINHSESSTGPVLMRPSRQDEGRWAKFIDIDHPKHIQNHPNFIRYDI